MRRAAIGIPITSVPFQQIIPDHRPRLSAPVQSVKVARLVYVLA
jgi:hypothetical protein